VITLEKRVPAGAGLGGGSSDAGAVLRGLRRYHRDALSPAELEELALALGADVPFFLDPEPALVRGIGEQRERVASPSLPLIVTHPGQALATADVFRAFAASQALLTPPGTLAGLPEIPDDPAVHSGELWAERVINDLESPATALCPAIAQLRTRLRDAGARGVGMSGSGPVVYGVFDDETGRDAALARLRLAPPARAWATSTKAGGRHDALRSL
jgi:4-diphosphocytidyl-2-C-methyl-D-erythritol kinase